MIPRLRFNHSFLFVNFLFLAFLICSVTVGSLIDYPVGFEWSLAWDLTILICSSCLFWFVLQRLVLWFIDHVGFERFLLAWNLTIVSWFLISSFWPFLICSLMVGPLIYWSCEIWTIPSCLRFDNSFSGFYLYPLTIWLSGFLAFPLLLCHGWSLNLLIPWDLNNSFLLEV